MVSEKSIQQHIRERAAHMNVRLFRNNVGVLRDERGRYITYGLCVGSSDLIGDYPIAGVSVFVAVEVKRPGQRTTPEQALFLKSVNERGGIGICCDSVEGFEFQLKEKLDGLHQVLGARGQNHAR
jgi:hypothetical protein